ncbi:MAG: hypothetical protein IJ303_03800 [Clostridia bacterium]|nr:hypothetical protein [Clostridia bacterium]
MPKNIFRYILCFLAAVLMLFAVSCSPDSGDKGKYGFEGGEKDGMLLLSDVAEYTLVRGDLCSSEETNALVALKNALEKSVDISLPISTDWLGKGQTEKEKEILIGKTNREESISAMNGLGYNDYVIKKIGSKLVIAGGSGEATEKAVDYFIEHYLDIYSAAVYYPETEYAHKISYTVSSVTIAGKPISEFKLFSADPETDLSSIQTALSEQTLGVKIEIADAIDEYSNYIIFERTGIIAAEYGVRLENDGNLYVFGSYSTFEQAVEYFKKSYFEELAKNKGTTAIDIKWHDNITLKRSDKSIYTKEKLMELLENVYADPDLIIAGENIAGARSMPSYSIEKYFEACGKYPAIIGIDLACYGLQLDSISDADFSRAVCELVDYAKKGGIITATSHFENPTGNWTLDGKCYGILGAEEKWEELLNSGSELNKKFTKELEADAVFLKALCENGVPVVWRPLNESNTDSFWFGAIQGEKTIPAEYLKRLWIYIYEYFESCGINNLIWVYSPSVAEGSLDAMYAYPGDEYIDMVGCSFHAYEKKAINSLSSSYKAVTEKSGKIGAICEFDIKSGSSIAASSKEEQKAVFSAADLLDELYALRSLGHSFAYILCSNGTGSVTRLGDGHIFAEDEMILTLEDVSAILYS